MTATQPDAEQTISRRGVMRKATAVGVGSAATVCGGSRTGGSPVGLAAAVQPIVVGGIGGVAAGKAADYLIKNVNNPFLGKNEDYSEAEADATHAGIRQNALNLKQSNEAVLGNINNLLNSSSNHIISQAKKAAIDKLDAGLSEQEAIDAAEAEVDQFYKTQEINMISHVSAVSSRYKSWFDTVKNTDSLSPSDVFRASGYSGFDTVLTRIKNISLLDGNTKEQTVVKFQSSNSNGFSTELQSDAGGSSRKLIIKPVGADGSNIKVRGAPAYDTILDEIERLHGDITTEMNTWVSGVAGKYQSGDIDTSDLVSANDLISDSQTEDGYSFAGASLASMGLKLNDFGLRIELVETGETVDGAIYHQDESIDALQKDVEYDPETDISGTVYIAYNNTDENKGELIGLEEPFIIREITDGDGNTYDAANFESKNQQTYDQDIEKIEKELQQVREIRKDLEEQRDAAAMNDGGGAGAGAGFFDESGPSIGAIAAGVGSLGLIYALFGQGDS